LDVYVVVRKCSRTRHSGKFLFSENWHKGFIDLIIF
jgi:hypothetical protein